ncbi:hypothetical protein ACFLQY_01260 [Verrucomicrobiota bacterium]
MNKPRTKPSYPKSFSEVALRSPVQQEDLPLPFVRYPDHYGAFIAFSEKEDTPAIFCECSKAAIFNAFKLNRSEALTRREFPATGLDKILPAPEHLLFRPHLCHRCNISSPSMRWCSDMYGGQFKQYFGWYIKQTKFRLGVTDYYEDFLPDACPDEVIEMVKQTRVAVAKEQKERERLEVIMRGPRRKDIAPDEIQYWSNIKLEEGKLHQELKRNAGKSQRELNNFFENITREEFGFRKIGDAFVSESLLHKIVCNIYPSEEILRHHRPAWLNGLELDIFIPALKVGLEYQGQQHFHPIKAWGGKKALQGVQERDAQKLDTCQSKGITLIAIDYTEPLTKAHVSHRLNTGTYTLNS